MIAPARVDPITVEVIKNSLVYASEEMGIAVRNSAYSPNIKDRLDHSCAIFDAQARLIAQAEHIPVHLGSLPWGLRATLAAIDAMGLRMAPGDMWVVNDPYISGTHLNDVTVIRPIFDNSGERLIGYSASKAHHTDIGGAVPGSMSADAEELFAEGLVIAPLRLMRGDVVQPEIVALVRSNSRNPHARSGDLKAQIAGSITGERRVLALIESYGLETYESAIERILDESERALRAQLATFRPGRYEVEEAMEDLEGNASVWIRLALTIADGGVTLDYTGTSPQVNFPINAVYGVTLSGIYYVVRALTDPSIPMNDGCFRPITVHIPEGTFLNPRRPAAVSGGNVETSQRNADTVLRAFADAAPDRVPASSGGTMSNVIVGGVDANGEAWTFYETNGCGMGARPTADGIDGIQAHMTNTLNTPIEAMEHYLPIRVTRYEFAEGTGGAGKYRGGFGLVRSWKMLEGSGRASLIAEHHTFGPGGLRGGADGAPGAHYIVRNGERKKLPGKINIPMSAGDEIIVQSPGGGGWGPAEESR
ncbi:MAG: hydantoinase B/oxoprolinase family protein [Vulcanimicrobiaceae bacterium]|jgi:N-methylhydantoinase B